MTSHDPYPDALQQIHDVARESLQLLGLGPTDRGKKVDIPGARARLATHA